MARTGFPTRESSELSLPQPARKTWQRLMPGSLFQTLNHRCLTLSSSHLWGTGSRTILDDSDTDALWSEQTEDTGPACHGLHLPPLRPGEYPAISLQASRGRGSHLLFVMGALQNPEDEQTKRLSSQVVHIHSWKPGNSAVSVWTPSSLVIKILDRWIAEGNEMVWEGRRNWNSEGTPVSALVNKKAASPPLVAFNEVLDVSRLQLKDQSLQVR